MFDRLKELFRGEGDNRNGMSPRDIISADIRAEEKDIHDTPTGALGTLIGSARQRRGMTLDEEARRLGISREDMIDIELGQKSPREIAEISKELQESLGLNDRQFSDVLLRETHRK